jgi:hypothetical protein
MDHVNMHHLAFLDLHKFRFPLFSYLVIPFDIIHSDSTTGSMIPSSNMKSISAFNCWIKFYFRHTSSVGVN